VGERDAEHREGDEPMTSCAGPVNGPKVTRDRERWIRTRDRRDHRCHARSSGCPRCLPER